MDFYKTECKTDNISVDEFGLCDNEDGNPAFVDFANRDIWIATIKNQKNKNITFVAVDKCVLKDNEYEGRGRCDCMLVTENKEHLFFVELKNKDKEWISDAISQLESTILFFKENYNIEEYRHKKIFACNRKRKRFKEIDNEENLAFFRRHKFRIDVQSEIIII